jgi:acetolactate synthase I/II/III large subunit
MRRALADRYELDDDPDRIDVDFVVDYLTREAYWARGRSRDVVKRSLAGSARVVGLYHGGRQVGFARVVSDGAVFAFLADVFVDEAHRGSGLGVELVREAVENGPHSGLAWRLATADAQGLYERFGFRETPSTVPAMWRAAVAPASPAPTAGVARERSGGEAIVDALLAAGVDTVFGLPGVQIYGLFDALQRAGEAVRVICPRHEQAAAYMAFGYAKATGRAGVYAVVPGPGVLNSTAALSTAYAASTPVVCLTGQIPSAFIGSGMGHLHELPDQLETLRTLTKWAARIERPEQAPALVAEAFRSARSGRPRPVALEMPWDQFDRRDMVAPIEPMALDEPPRASEASLDRAAELLRGARSPMIMVGGGAQAASAEVLALAELLQAPVVPFRSGRGVVSSDHPLGFSCADGFERWAQTDVLLGIGSRLELAWFRWPDRPDDLAIVDIDIDPHQPVRVGADVALVGDAAATTAQLTALLREASAERPSRAAEFEQLRAVKRAEIERVRPHIAYLDAIREALPRDGFFVEELCQAGFASYFAFPVYEPRTFVTAGAQGTLGFGFQTALGVKAAHPDRKVVSITGDGGFQFGLQELATAAQYSLDVVTVLFDNSAYGNVLRDQERLYDGRVLGAELRNPDFAALAASYGIRATTVAEPAGLSSALDQALSRSEPELIVVPVDPAIEDPPWRFLMPGSRWA